MRIMADMARRTGRDYPVRATCRRRGARHAQRPIAAVAASSVNARSLSLWRPTPLRSEFLARSPAVIHRRGTESTKLLHASGHFPWCHSSRRKP